jgi:hypothetical protein
LQGNLEMGYPFFVAGTLAKGEGKGMARTDKPERRRFDRDKEFKIWNKEEREQYEGLRNRLAPLVRDLITPAPKEKKKDPLAELLGL